MPNNIRNKPFRISYILFGFMLGVIIMLIVFLLAHSWKQTYTKIPQVNKDFNGYAGIGLTMTNFNFDDDTVSCAAEYLLSSGVQQAVEKSGQSFPIKIFLYSTSFNQYADIVLDNNKLTPPVPQVTQNSNTWAPTTLTISGISGMIRVIGPTLESDENWQIGVPTDCNVNVIRDDFSYPYDKYRITLVANMDIPQGVPLPSGNYSFNQNIEMPFAFTVATYLKGYKVIVSPTPRSNNSIGITIERGGSEIAYVWILLSILIAASICAFSYSWWLLRHSRETVDIQAFIAMVGLFIAIPSSRAIIVPSQIQGWTMVDLILFFCLLLMIFNVFVLMIKYYYQRKNKNNNSPEYFL